MEYVIAIDESVATVYQSMTSHQYWYDLAKVHLENAPTELTEFSSDDNGTEVVFTHAMDRDGLPPFVAALVPKRLAVSRAQHFDPFDAASNSATGHYAVHVPAAPLKLGGNYVLSATDTGTDIKLSTDCKVNVPLVGRKVEDMLLNGLRTFFDAERQFTTTWIADHL